MNSANDDKLNLISVRLLFFDNNFLNRLFQGRYSSSLADLSSPLTEALLPPFAPWRTPFSLMELLGIPAKKLRTPAAFDIRGVSDFDLILEPFKHYRAHYSSLAELDITNLRRLAVEQRKHVAPEQVRLWDAYMGGLSWNEDLARWIRDALARDAMQRLLSCRNELICEWIVKEDFSTNNDSKLRLAYRYFQEFINQNVTGRMTQERRIFFQTLQKTARLENRADYLDCDLIHFATMGAASKSGNRLQVVCITGDEPDTILVRLSLYKGFLRHIREVYGDPERENVLPFDYEQGYNGQVLCFDGEGKLRRKIDVSELSPLCYFVPSSGRRDLGG